MQAAASFNFSPSLIANYGDHEIGLLGALLTDHERNAWIIPHLEQSLFSAGLQKIFLAIETAKKGDKPWDTVTVSNFLKERFGDAQRALVSELGMCACIPSLVGTYAVGLRERRSSDLLQNAQGLIEQGTNSAAIAAQIARWNQPIYKVEVTGEDLGVIKPRHFAIGDVANEVLEETKLHRHQSGTIKGIPTGIAMLDDLTLGFQDGDMIIVAARPTEGKTVFGMTVAGNVSRGYKLPVGYVCLEMSRYALVRRYLSAQTRVDTKYMRQGIVDDAEVALLEEEAARMRDLKLTLVDQSAGIRTVNHIKRWFHFMEEKPSLLIVDHLHILDGENAGGNQFQTVSEVSTSLKRLAGDIEIPVMVLCQLSRPEKQSYVKGKPVIVKPTLASLRSSGNIEQDADHVIFIHRPHTQDPEKPIGEAYLLVRKNREGESDKDIPVLYQPGRAFLNENGITSTRDLYSIQKENEYKAQHRAPDTPPVQDAQGVIDCSPEPAQQADEQTMSFEPEETEVEEVDAERREKEDGSVVWQTKTASAYGPEHKVWSHESCEMKIRKAIRDGSITDLFTKSAAWLGGFLNGGADDAEVSWAAECSERLGEVYDRVMKEIEEEKTTMFPRSDIDLSAFGF